MRITIRPMVDPLQQIDVTKLLIAAIAEELWRRYGGNAELNWLEAQRHLYGLIRGESKAAAVLAAVGGDRVRTGSGPARQVAKTGRSDGRRCPGRMARVDAGGPARVLARGVRKTETWQVV